MNAQIVVNLITIYRIVAAPLLLYLALTHNIIWFKWLLPVSFFTDAIDGYIARKFKATSILGSRLDSIGDDLTIGVAIAGMFVFHDYFVFEHLFIILLMLFLFLFQLVQSFVRYRKPSSFHTYLAKTAAVLQGIFLILAFFSKEPNLLLFYFASAVTIVELIEEIILVFLLKEWETDVKGLYGILKRKEKSN